MCKKIVSIFLAILMVFPVLLLAVSADEPEPTSATYTLEQLAASLEDGATPIVLQPNDTVTWTGEGNYQYLIFAYTTDGKDGSKSYSPTNHVVFADCGVTMTGDVGYSVKSIGPNSTTTHVSKTDMNALVGNTGYARAKIDFTTDKEEVTFAGWQVKEVYTNGYNRITVCAIWDIPEIPAWDSFMNVVKGYLRTVVTYLFNGFFDLLIMFGEALA